MSTVASNGKKDFQSIRAELLSTHSHYVDAGFPPDATSLTYSGEQPFQNVRIKWLRPIDIVSKPKFITERATSFDLTQGALGDCWFVAGATLLVFQHRNYFVKVVPEDQGFGKNYAGIFHFNFWCSGRWKEVIIDDFLPTNGHGLVYGHSKTSHEFWIALLEKAYAKLHGCYQALEGSTIQSALVDLTGGISEVIDIEDKCNVRPNLFDLLRKIFHMQSMICCIIHRAKNSDASEVLHSNGLYSGHAYSITGLELVSHSGKYVPLVRLMNPWSCGEWKGAWSNKSSQMTGLSSKERQSLKLVVKDETEFWMSFEDLLHNFDEIKLCHIQLDTHTENIAADKKQVQWNVVAYHNSWNRGLTAGGCGNSPNEKKYWKNPQFQVTLSKPDDDDGDHSTLIIDLMEKVEKKLSNVSIGFDVYKVQNHRTSPLGPGDEYSKYSTVRQNQFHREVCRRYELPTGNYIIIPSTIYPNEEAHVLLRMFTLKKVDSVILDEKHAAPVLAAPAPDIVIDIFNKNCGEDRKLDVNELQAFLSEIADTELHVQLDISKESYRSLLAMKDKDKSGFLEFLEAKEVWQDVATFTHVFQQFDANGSGTVDTFELSNMFKYLGFPITLNMLTSIVRRYGGRNNTITLDDFIIVMSKLVLMFHVFSNHHGYTGKTNDSVPFTRNEFLEYALMC